MNWLGAALAEGPLLGDGAMGTMLFRAGLAPGASAELWNVEQPDLVAGVHRGYAEAGSAFVTANTFGATPLALARHGLADRTAELNAAAVALAREAVGDRVRVMGDIGPFGGFLEPYGEASTKAVEETYRAQVAALRVAGADGVLVETMVDPNELTIAVRAARQAGDWPVLASYAFQRMGAEFRTIMGTGVAEALGAAFDAGADAAGANCGTNLSLDDYLQLADELVAAAKGRPVVLQPNAGPPRASGTEIEYSATPQEMGKWAARAAEVGVRVLGGCCGTTPAHVAAMAQVLRR
ncbi:MAG: homocysteine S-methyltransferase family protein [Fimbriimonadaceae bacterium]|nr:homocysteine S-methyltransferase family protein [Chthonomonadaceae bacterium]MCO5296252.1 homocysteine S-methyltransferase family protein [Fimbriimonadaceae bacterium]